MVVIASVDDRIIGVLDALADRTRLEILGLLRERDRCVCHLVDALRLKQSLVSHHVGVLRRAGLVVCYPHPTDRRWVYYRLDRGAIAGLQAHLGWLTDASGYDPTPQPCPVGGGAAMTADA